MRRPLQLVAIAAVLLTASLGFGRNARVAARRAPILGAGGASSKKTWRVGMLSATTDNRHVIKDPLTAVLKAIRHNPTLDILVGPEWLFVPEGLVYDAAEFRKIQRAIESASRGTQMLIAPGTIAWKKRGKYRNTMLCISNGETLKAYSKRSLSNDSAIARQAGLRAQKGEERGTFAWRAGERTYSVGVEICADHMEGQLVDATRTAGAAKPLDIQLLASNAQFSLWQPNLAIAAGGLFISNSGHRAYRREALDVRHFKRATSRSGRSVSRLHDIDEDYERIEWARGRVQKRQKLTDEVDLVVYSVLAPR